MISVANIINQINMDRTDLESIYTILDQLSKLTQQYGVCTYGEDYLTATSLIAEINRLNHEISTKLVSIYSHREALTEGIVVENIL